MSNDSNVTKEILQKLFPENWETPKGSIGYCYVTYCKDVDQFYVGKKQSPNFLDTYFGSGKAIKLWESMRYSLENWPISWAFKSEDLLIQERTFVEMAKTLKNCANIYAGGAPAMTGRKHSPETIQKMRESAKKIKHQPMSQETKDRISKANMGKHSKTEEERRAVGDFHRGRKRSAETCKRIGLSKSGENNPNFGKPRSEETKRKISQAQVGRKFTPEHKEKLRQARLRYLEKMRKSQNEVESS